MSVSQAGIPSNPVLFEDGLPLPSIPELGPAHPQNLWHSIEANQRWVGTAVLGLTGKKPYKEQPQPNDLQTQIAIADERRLDDKKYSANRNLSSLAGLLYVHDDELIHEEFRDRSVLDIGSGAGELGNNLRCLANADVTEVDFSPAAFRAMPPVFGGRGRRILGDGRNLDIADAQYERTVSMFSVSVHTDTIGERLSGLTEMLRVTTVGGRAFDVPFLGGMVLRQSRWVDLQRYKHDPRLTPEDVQELEHTLKREAAIDYALTNVVRTLMLNNVVQFTPILTHEVTGREAKDCISGIFDIQRTLTKPEASELIDQEVARFS